MPTYAYECPNCKQKEERFVPMSERSVQICEKCAQRLQQVITGTQLNIETIPGYGKRYTN